jgi:hypothetical protein
MKDRLALEPRIVDDLLRNVTRKTTATGHDWKRLYLGELRDAIAPERPSANRPP